MRKAPRQMTLLNPGGDAHLRIAPRQLVGAVPSLLMLPRLATVRRVVAGSNQLWGGGLSALFCARTALAAMLAAVHGHRVKAVMQPAQ